MDVQWVGDQRREGSHHGLQTAFFGLVGRTDAPAVSLELQELQGEGAVNLRLRTPWQHSAHKADTPLAVLLAMLEELEREVGPREMVGADFTIFDFIFFFILFDIFKMEPLLQIDCLQQYELGK